MASRKHASMPIFFGMRLQKRYPKVIESILVSGAMATDKDHRDDGIIVLGRSMRRSPGGIRIDE